MSEKYIKNITLLGNENYNKIVSKTVAVIGVGGVGGYAVEAFARLGVKRILICDNDVVDKTNINRQIIALASTIGKKKVDVAKKRIKDINKDIEVITVDKLYNEATKELLLKNKVDFVVDAIDSLTSKWTLIKSCLDNKIDFISSLGMGNRLDPTKIEISSLDKTINDPLAKRLRTMARKEKYDLSKINCIFSKETPVLKVSPPSSIIFNPAVAGLYCAYYFLNLYLKLNN